MKAAMAEYRKKLAEYTKAYDAFDKIAGPYWRDVTDKRSRRRTKVANNMRLSADDYVMTQPPVYSGPEKPENPLQPGKKRSDIPDVDRLPRQCAGRVRLRPRGAGRRGHLQARLRQGRRRRRPHQGGGRQDLRL